MAGLGRPDDPASHFGRGRSERTRAADSDDVAARATLAVAAASASARSGRSSWQSGLPGVASWSLRGFTVVSMSIAENIVGIARADQQPQRTVRTETPKKSR